MGAHREEKLSMFHAITAGLKTSFANADGVLKNRLDKLVPILALDNAAFATDLWNSRNIYDSGRPSVGGGDSGADDPHPTPDNARNANSIPRRLEMSFLRSDFSLRSHQRSPDRVRRAQAPGQE